MNELIEAGEQLAALLELKRGLVGIKLVQSHEEFDRYDGRTLKAPMPYCVAVECATRGHAAKLTAATSGCSGSTRALGLAAPTPAFFEGEEGVELGLYESTRLAAEVAGQLARIEAPTHGVVVKPLADFEQDCDVVLIVTNSYNAMRLVQGYSYVFGMHGNFNMMGNQAVCVESTVLPLQTQTINVSLLCSGTRHNARWSDDELMVGIPATKFVETVRGVRATVNAVESDARKADIAQRLQTRGDETADIKPGEAYYLRLK